jgi:hypothetical protein
MDHGFNNTAKTRYSTSTTSIQLLKNETGKI